MLKLLCVLLVATLAHAQWEVDMDFYTDRPAELTEAQQKSLKEAENALGAAIQEAYNVSQQAREQLVQTEQELQPVMPGPPMPPPPIGPYGQMWQGGPMPPPPIGPFGQVWQEGPMPPPNDQLGQTLQEGPTPPPNGPFIQPWQGRPMPPPIGPFGQPWQGPPMPPAIARAQEKVQKLRSEKENELREKLEGAEAPLRRLQEEMNQKMDSEIRERQSPGSWVEDIYMEVSERVHRDYAERIQSLERKVGEAQENLGRFIFNAGMDDPEIAAAQQEEQEAYENYEESRVAKIQAARDNVVATIAKQKCNVKQAWDRLNAVKKTIVA